ncbi:MULTISPECIES: hypothetical protein [unclassified Kitasatospora]|uniref:hypothetical protein n=1 Tax=unclassified Kitasatospora TaxID=2633591 RepID=UPI00340B03A6
MGVADIVVMVAAAVLIAGLGWYFFGPRRAQSARLEGRVQRVDVTVRGERCPSWSPRSWPPDRCSPAGPTAPPPCP